MAKISFTPAQKAKAMMLISKGMSGSAVCEEIGCSSASLQNWKKEYQEGKFTLDDLDDDEAEETPPQKASHTPSHSVSHHSSIATRRSSISIEDFIRDYWQHKSVDTVMNMPKTIDEVVKLVNHALTYAHDHLAD